jgi:hypothetical protein
MQDMNECSFQSSSFSMISSHPNSCVILKPALPWPNTNSIPPMKCPLLHPPPTPTMEMPAVPPSQQVLLKWFTSYYSDSKDVTYANSVIMMLVS